MKKEAKQFLERLHGDVEFWTRIAERDQLSYKEFAESIIFSILTDIDGCGSNNTILLFNTDDNGDLTECINDVDELHENWYK